MMNSNLKSILSFDIVFTMIVGLILQNENPDY